MRQKQQKQQEQQEQQEEQQEQEQEQEQEGRECAAHIDSAVCSCVRRFDGGAPRAPRPDV